MTTTDSIRASDTGELANKDAKINVTKIDICAKHGNNYL